MTKLDKLKALMAKATPGPWAVDPDDRPKMEWNNHIVGADTNFTVCFMTHDNTPENVEGFANADLITIAINALPALIAAVEALKDAADALGVGRTRLTLCSPDVALKISAALAPFGDDDEQTDIGRA